MTSIPHYFSSTQAWITILLLLATWCMSVPLCDALPESRKASRRSSQALAVIPGAGGFGIMTPAGSGRHLSPPRTSIFVVTSLADFGTGTLRACAEASGPRTCVFQIGGTIELSRQIRIRHPYLTIAGETSPEPGVTLINSGITVATHDVLIRHLTIRPGDAPNGAAPVERDGISIGAKPPEAAYNVVIDHTSLTWAIDENISTAYPTTRDVTISHSLIAEGLHRSIHPKGAHSKGLMVGDGSRNITITRNLLAFNEERNPYIKPGTTVEFINNIVYGWGPGGGWSLCNITNNTASDAPIQLSFIGNIYRPGPDSARVPFLYAKSINSESRIYSKNNTGPTDVNDSHLITLSRAVTLPQSDHPPVTSHLPEILPSTSVWSVVLSSAGARPRSRSRADRRILEEVSTGTGGIKDCTVGCAHSVGLVNDDQSSSWKLEIPARPHEDDDNDGYTNLEEWLHLQASLLE